MTYRMTGSAFFALQLVSFLVTSSRETNCKIRLHYILDRSVFTSEPQGSLLHCRFLRGLSLDEELCPLRMYALGATGLEYIQSVVGRDEGVYS